MLTNVSSYQYYFDYMQDTALGAGILGLTEQTRSLLSWSLHPMER